jgi:nucleotide sugar dehydrogenase
MKQSLREQLLNGNKAVGVWGLGFIGYSSMANFALAGVRCKGTDVDEYKVDCVNKGNVPTPNLEYWLGFDPKILLSTARMIQATTNWEELIDRDIAVHLICIPTEKGDKPHLDILQDVILKLSRYKGTGSRPLIIIESTLTPNTTDTLVIPLLEKEGLQVGQDILVGVAPRRDWFVSADKSLKTLPRVVGGTTPETTDLMRSALGIVCDTVLPAKDHRHAELIKGIENAYRHVEITLANQLSAAYPEVDMRDVLRLVGTKWNIGHFFPSFGTGGYCIPLSSQYILAGTENPSALSILQAAVATDRGLPAKVADAVIASGAKRVGILGLAYKGDLKVHTLSPTLRIVERLKQRVDAVKVNDPYYSAEEIDRICGVDSFTFPQGLSEFDTVLLVADHRLYTSVNRSKILGSLTNCKRILDNTGIWQDIDFASRGISYRLAGRANWL